MTRIGLLCLFFLVLGTVVSGAQTYTEEQEKLFQIVQGLEVRKPFVGERVDEKEQKFCRSLLTDLKARRGIQFVEPIVATDDYDDPKLQSYLRQCPNLKLNKSVSFEPRIWEYAKTLPEEEREKLGTVWRTSTGFRLFYVDIDNNPRNGKEYVFYGAGGFTMRKEGHRICSDNSDYKIFNERECLQTDSQQVGDAVECLGGSPTGNSNGIIQYKGRSVIFNGKYFRIEKAYSVYVYWRESKKRVRTGLCTFTKSN